MYLYPFSCLSKKKRCSTSDKFVPQFCSTISIYDIVSYFPTLYHISATPQSVSHNTFNSFLHLLPPFQLRFRPPHTLHA